MKSESFHEALAIALSVSRSSSHLEGLARIGEHISQPLLSEAATLLGGWSSDEAKAFDTQGLSVLTHRLSDPEQRTRIIQRVLDVTWAETEDASRFHSRCSVQELEDETFEPGLPELDSIAGVLDEAILRQAIKAVQGLSWDYARAKALAVLLSRLAALGFAEESLLMTPSISYDKWRSRALTGIMDRLRKRPRDGLLIHIKGISLRVWRDAAAPIPTTRSALGLGV